MSNSSSQKTKTQNFIYNSHRKEHYESRSERTSCIAERSRSNVEKFEIETVSGQQSIGVFVYLYRNGYIKSVMCQLILVLFLLFYLDLSTDNQTKTTIYNCTSNRNR